MKTLRTLVLPGITMVAVALLCYSIYTTGRVQTLEHRFKTTEERLQRVEDNLKLRFELLGSNDTNR
ncbi:hypothetical protein [Verrucomicrobium sp. BvORR034]|uniref:hypothetical protein n=1 Tax=Verrucomicrobium sp. BvORR034 TaxID=1396418 RepID=UPI002240F0A0|nr:hypothetical protein [Verrucomicrobium sp. BvORR034]